MALCQSTGVVARGRGGRADGRGVELLHVHALRVAREMTSARGAGLLIVVLILLRAGMAGFAPLAFDEAYYWLWSKHLAAGYLDHPPMIAWIIRASILIFGDTAFGIRFVPFLL